MKTSKLEPLYDINLTKDPYLYKVNNVNHKHGNDTSIEGPYLLDIDDVTNAPIRNSPSSSTNCLSNGHVHINGDVGLSYNENHFRIVDNKLEINVPYFLKHLTVNNGTGAGDYFPKKLVSISANAIPGKTFTNWTVQSGQLSYIANTLANNTTFKMPWPPADCECTANYEDVKYVITVIATPGGTVSPGTSTVAWNSNIVFTITPNAHYHTATILINNTPITIVNTYTFQNVLTNHSINVAFAINSCRVQYIIGTGTRIGGGEVEQYVPYNTGAIEPIITANLGYTFLGWDRPSTQIIDDVNTTIITAQYRHDEYKLIYATDANGHISGNVIQTGHYLNSGTEVIAIPNNPTMYEFDKWDVDASLANRTDIFGLTDKYFNATFKTIKHTLTVVGGTGAGSYQAGTVIAVSALNISNRNAFNNWTIPAGTLATGYVATMATVQYIMPEQNVTLTANTATKYLLTALNEKYPQQRYVAASAQSTIEARDIRDAETSFNTWIIFEGLGSFITNAKTCVYVMPACDSTICATYNIAVPPTPHTLVVDSGSGDGSYINGTSVNICADAPAIGKRFDKWAYISGGGTISNLNAACTTYIMPDNDARITATYVDNLYTLNVIKGTPANGVYAYNAQIAITASGEANSVFNNWITSSGGSFGNTAVSNTIFTMPANNVTVTATYTLMPYLTVAGGVTSGYYAKDTNTTITANTPEIGKTFDKWTASPAAPIYVNSTADSTPATITMPANNITMTANYKNTLWTLIVTNGTGSILNGCIYHNNYAVAANTPAAGKMFDKWTGDTSAMTSDTNVYMPNAHVSITATYKDIPVVLYTLTVTSGSGSGSYAAGTVVNITSSAPAAGKVFDKWTGDAVASDISSSTTSTIPARNTTVTATYKDAYVNIIVISGYNVTVKCGSQSAVGVGSSFILNAIVGQTYSFWVSNAAEAWWWAASAAACTGANRGSDIAQQGFSITMNSDTLTKIQTWGANIFVGS